jgi:hypothetical protein
MSSGSARRRSKVAASRAAIVAEASAAYHVVREGELSLARSVERSHLRERSPLGLVSKAREQQRWMILF